MEIQYYGANCVRISTKKASLTIDDNLSQYGLKSPVKPEDILLTTFVNGTTPSSGFKIAISEPGEYEVSNVSIQGIPARAHMDEKGQHSATIYRVVMDDVRIAVIGHVHPDLSNTQLETIGVIDLLIIPTGGNGYTLDALGALKIIKAVDAKIVIPTHYADDAIAYEVPQAPLDEALKTFALEPHEVLPKLKIKNGEISELTKLIVLERQ